MRRRTGRRRDDAGGPESIATRFTAVLDCIDNLGLDLPIFLSADGKARYERSALIHSEELPQILERWRNTLLEPSLF